MAGKNRRKQKLYPAGESPGSKHQDRYAEVAAQPQETLAVWRRVFLSEQNCEALDLIVDRLRPVIEASGEANFVDPDKMRFKVLGGSAVERALHLTRSQSTDLFRTTLKTRLQETASKSVTTTSTAVRGLRPRTTQPMYIHVGIEGVPHEEMDTAAATLNSVYGRELLKKRPFASFEIATIQRPSEDPNLLTSRLRGIDFGNVLLGSVQVPSEYPPLY